MSTFLCFCFLSLCLSSFGLAAPKIVVVFGDSITAGSALPAAERSQAWVNSLQSLSTDRLTVLNEGRGGRPSDSLPEFEAMLKKHPKIDVLLLALGTNDSRDVSALCVPKAVANLRSMINRARETHGSPLSILLLGPPNLRKDALGPTRPIADQREAKLKELGVGFAALATELHCQFLSLYGLIPDASLTRDGVHPDGPGNLPIAKAVLQQLLPTP